MSREPRPRAGGQGGAGGPVPAGAGPCWRGPGVALGPGGGRAPLGVRVVPSLVGRERCWAQPGFRCPRDGQRVDPASLGLFQAALCRGTRRVKGGKQQGGPPAHSPLLPSPGSGIHLRLHRGNPHPTAAPVPPGPHVLPIPLLLPLLPDPQPVCECPPSFSAAPRALVPLCWGLWGCVAALPSCSLAGFADGPGSSEQSRALPPPCSHSTPEIHPLNPAWLCCWG